MSRSKVVQVILYPFFLLMLASCGSQSAGGGAGEFTTVMMSAQAKTSRLESDVLTGNSCPTSSTSGGTYVTDTINVDINSIPYQNIAVTPLPVRITKYTVTYTPKTVGTPAIPPQPFLDGTVVDSGKTATIPVTVAPDLLKVKLVTDFNLQLCSTTIYEYYVTITFTGVEIGGSGNSHDFSTNMDVAFADRSGS